MLDMTEINEFHPDGDVPPHKTLSRLTIVAITERGHLAHNHSPKGLHLPKAGNTAISWKTNPENIRSSHRPSIRYSQALISCPQLFTNAESAINLQNLITASLPPSHVIKQQNQCPMFRMIGRDIMNATGSASSQLSSQ
jgi:hypothetical protein